MPLHFQSTVVDLFAAPSLVPLPLTKILPDGHCHTVTTGDSQGNVLRLIHAFCAAGTATCSKEDYDAIKDAYYLPPSRENYEIYERALDKIKWNPAIQFRSLGDNLNDRGNQERRPTVPLDAADGGKATDKHMLLLVKKAVLAGVRLRIPISNHDLAALQQYFGYGYEALYMPDWCTMTSRNLLSCFITDEECGTTLEEIVGLLREYYIPCIRLIDYDTDPETGKLVIYSHAPIDLPIIIEFATNLGLLTKRLTFDHYVKYYAVNPKALTNLIDRINNTVKTLLLVNKFPKESLSNMLSREITYPHVSLSSDDLWNCFIGLRDFTALSDGARLAELGSYTWVHGHTVELGLEGQHSLDSPTGRPGCSSGVIPMYYSHAAPFQTLTPDEVRVMFPVRWHEILRAKLPEITDEQMSLVCNKLFEVLAHFGRKGFIRTFDDFIYGGALNAVEIVDRTPQELLIKTDQFIDAMEKIRSALDQVNIIKFVERAAILLILLENKGDALRCITSEDLQKAIDNNSAKTVLSLKQKRPDIPSRIIELVCNTGDDGWPEIDLSDTILALLKICADNLDCISEDLLYRVRCYSENGVGDGCIDFLIKLFEVAIKKGFPVDKLFEFVDRLFEAAELEQMDRIRDGFFVRPRVQVDVDRLIKPFYEAKKQLNFEECLKIYRDILKRSESVSKGVKLPALVQSARRGSFTSTRIEEDEQQLPELDAASTTSFFRLE